MLIDDGKPYNLDARVPNFVAAEITQIKKIEKTMKRPLSRRFHWCSHIFFRLQVAETMVTVESMYIQVAGAYVRFGRRRLFSRQGPSGDGIPITPRETQGGSNLCRCIGYFKIFYAGGS